MRNPFGFTHTSHFFLVWSVTGRTPPDSDARDGAGRGRGGAAPQFSSMFSSSLRPANRFRSARVPTIAPLALRAYRLAQHGSASAFRLLPPPILRSEHLAPSNPPPLFVYLHPRKATVLRLRERVHLHRQTQAAL